MNSLFKMFAKCVNKVSDNRMVIETNVKDGVGEEVYWLVDFNDANDTNEEYYGCKGSVVSIIKCFTDGAEFESYEFATYEDGWAKVKELAHNAKRIYVEGY